MADSLMIDGDKELLLQAAFLETEAAENAWQQWCARVKLDDVDLSDYQILPQLHARAGADDARIQGIHRRTWYSNRLLIHKVLPILAALRAAGIRAVVYKETAAVLSEPACHPLDRFHLAVLETDTVAVADVLEGQGWRTRGGRVAAEFLAISRVVNFHDNGDAIVQLHTRPDGDEEFWRRAAGCDYEGHRLSVSGADDQLLDTAAPEWSWHRVPLFLRVAGAMTVIRQQKAQFDWDYLATKAQSCGLVLPLLDVVNYTVEKLEAPIPQTFVGRLHGADRSAQRAYEYHCRTGRVTLWRRLALLWFDYRRAPAMQTPRVLGFVEYLRRRWRLTSIWQLPLRVVTRSSRRR